MNQSLTRTTLFAAILFSVAAVAFAQAPSASSQAATDQAIEQLRKDARTEVNAIIGANMQFTSDEAAKFWPLYKEYEARRKALADERLAIIKDYAANYRTMTDAKALELTQRGLAQQEKGLAAKKAFLAELQKALPGKTVARFYQVHNRLDMMADLLIAQEVPLVQ